MKAVRFLRSNVKFWIAAVALGAAVVAVACVGDTEVKEAAVLTGGDPSVGRGLIRRYGCGSCHTIPRVPGATGLVGPPLTGVANRVYIGGVVRNSPRNMVRWIRHPRNIDPMTAMPDVGVTEKDARDIAAFLYTLR
jgi:cytochrome c2